MKRGTLASLLAVITCVLTLAGQARSQNDASEPASSTAQNAQIDTSTDEGGANGEAVADEVGANERRADELRRLAAERSAAAQGVIAAALPAEAQEVIKVRVLGNTIGAWIAALVVLAVFHLVIVVIRRMVLARLRTRAQRWPGSVLSVLVAMADDVRTWCIFLVSLYVASRVLELPALVDAVVRVLGIGALALQVLITSRLAIDHGVKHILHRTAQTPDGQPDAELASASGIIRFLAMLILGVLVLLLALQNMGVEVTPLITGLGVGGIAVALAAQNVLQDLFASLTIVFDKPFLVGDFIIVGDEMGTVERIGIKTTRVRALSGEQLVFSNADLLGSRIQNFKRMQERRVVFAIGVIYETSPALLKEIPGIVRQAVENATNGSVSGVKGRLDRCHFKSFGAYSLDFETVYYINTREYNPYMDVQQTINLELFEVFAAKGIEFAYPTQMEIVRGENPSSGDKPVDPVAMRRPVDAAKAD